VTNIPFSDESEAFAKQIFSDVKNIEATDIIDKYINHYYHGRLPITKNTIKTRDYDPIVKKRLFQFSLFKCSPYAIRTKVYNNGVYMDVDDKERRHAGNYTRAMLKNYFALLCYPQMTKIIDDDRNNCVISVNELTHAPVFLQYPNYEPVVDVTNKGNGLFSDDPSYHVTMLGFLLISKWLDYIKENGIWDNTKIIIMSDHGWFGYDNKIPANITLPNGNTLQKFNSMLLVKDFGATKELSVDSTFMTNADIPSIAVKDIIGDPRNPFTSEPLYTDKDSGIIVPTAWWKPLTKHGEYTYDFKNDGWLKVKENIFKIENWTKHYIEK